MDNISKKKKSPVGKVFLILIIIAGVVGVYYLGSSGILADIISNIGSNSLEKDIVGEWKFTMANGVVATLNFGNDGSFSFLASSDEHTGGTGVIYRVDGDTVFFTHPDGTEEIYEKVRIENDTLYIYGDTMPFVRVNVRVIYPTTIPADRATAVETKEKTMWAYMTEGDFESAVEWAKNDSEMTKEAGLLHTAIFVIENTNVIACLSSLTAKALMDSSSFKLRNAWFSDTGVVLEINGKNSFGALIVNYWYYAYDKDLKRYQFAVATADFKAPDIDLSKTPEENVRGVVVIAETLGIIERGCELTARLKKRGLPVQEPYRVQI